MFEPATLGKNLEPFSVTTASSSSVQLQATNVTIQPPIMEQPSHTSLQDTTFKNTGLENLDPDSGSDFDSDDMEEDTEDEDEDEDLSDDDEAELLAEEMYN